MGPASVAMGVHSLMQECAGRATQAADELRQQHGNMAQGHAASKLQAGERTKQH